LVHEYVCIGAGWNFPLGYALATVFVNGIQSRSGVVNISVPVPVPATLTGVGKTSGAFRFYVSL